MAEPATAVVPAEDAAAEEVVRQAWKPVVIEGGKAAPEVGGSAAEATLLGRVMAGASGALMFFTVLLWPSETSSDDERPNDPSPLSGPKPDVKPDPKPVAVPEQQPVTQECNKEKAQEELCERWADKIRRALDGEQSSVRKGTKG